MPKTIDRQTLKQKLDAGEDFHLVEVLSEQEFERLHIPGAAHIAFNRMGAEAAKRFEKDDEIVLYCMDPECRASPIAAEKLENMGFTRVFVYRGGKKDWVDAGLPAEGNEAKSSNWNAKGL